MLPGEIPTMLLLRADGVMPTIEPPDWPSIITTSLLSRLSGVVFVESTVKSHFPSFPATDLQFIAEKLNQTWHQSIEIDIVFIVKLQFTSTQLQIS